MRNLSTVLADCRNSSRKGEREINMSSSRSDKTEGTHQSIYVDRDQADDMRVFVTRDTANQALQSIIQVHFEKTLEKKRQVDLQKKELWKLFMVFYLFLAILLVGVLLSNRLKCRHSWPPIALCALAHIIFYVAMAQTLRAVNGFKYQRRCHKLTLALATEKLKALRGNPADSVSEEDFEVHYQEPHDDYLNKFQRKWALFTLFLTATFAVMVSGIATTLCI
ncbi:hypothetical protein AXG93_4225s1530 [Marchantia polymorpha subsp. ruderalis]|uniref:Transmembrane protein n=2 Tax=Marchantia polymorpha TaxID=3197 RepID=A0A176WRU3_MARPO|nr:hypothetical protein AXG93_4225s1530 [Marchantia polymorpha subsp. ruderalis]